MFGETLVYIFLGADVPNTAAPAVPVPAKAVPAYVVPAPRWWRHLDLDRNQPWTLQQWPVDPAMSMFQPGTIIHRVPLDPEFRIMCGSGVT